MSLSKTDVELILVIAEMWPHKTADEVIKILESFHGSQFDMPQYDLRTCLAQYVNFLMHAGKEL